MAGRTVGQGRGSVYAGGKVYLEGSTIPDDVKVGDHVFTDASDDSAGQVVNQVVVVGDGEGGEDSDDLTAGSIGDVLDRVGDDPAKAAAAREAEEAKAKPRSSLLEKLQAIVNGAS
jgi:hypothetical protein